MGEMQVRPAQSSDCEPLAEMRAALWPESSLEEHRQEMIAILSGVPMGTLPEVTLVAESGGEVVGFLEAGLRSHADGCDVRQPVGYVEGWYVAEGHRRQGVGAALVKAAEEWARSHGCIEMASDSLIDNEASQEAHVALGFEVVDRCVHYRKTISKRE